MTKVGRGLEYRENGLKQWDQSTLPNSQPGGSATRSPGTYLNETQHGGGALRTPKWKNYKKYN